MGINDVEGIVEGMNDYCKGMTTGGK